MEKYEVLTDEKIESLWDELESVPFDEDEEQELTLSIDWLHFEAKTNRETIWYWFDESHSKGVAFLMNNNDVYKKKENTE